MNWIIRMIYSYSRSTELISFSVRKSGFLINTSFVLSIMQNVPLNIPLYFLDNRFPGKCVLTIYNNNNTYHRYLYPDHIQLYINIISQLLNIPKTPNYYSSYSLCETLSVAVNVRQHFLVCLSQWQVTFDNFCSLFNDVTGKN